MCWCEETGENSYMSEWMDVGTVHCTQRARVYTFVRPFGGWYYAHARGSDCLGQIVCMRKNGCDVECVVGTCTNRHSAVVTRRPKCQPCRDSILSASLTVLVFRRWQLAKQTATVVSFNGPTPIGRLTRALRVAARNTISLLLAHDMRCAYVWWMVACCESDRIPLYTEHALQCSMYAARMWIASSGHRGYVMLWLAADRGHIEWKHNGYAIRGCAHTIPNHQPASHSPSRVVSCLRLVLAKCVRVHATAIDFHPWQWRSCDFANPSLKAITQMTTTIASSRAATTTRKKNTTQQHSIASHVQCAHNRKYTRDTPTQSCMRLAWKNTKSLYEQNVWGKFCRNWKYNKECNRTRDKIFSRDCFALRIIQNVWFYSIVCNESKRSLLSIPPFGIIHAPHTYFCVCFMLFHFCSSNALRNPYHIYLSHAFLS